MSVDMKDWSVGEYLSHFEKEIVRASEERFKTAFKELAGELMLLDSQFMTQSKGCGTDLDNVLELFHSLSGRLGYCERPRGFEKDCDKLYADVQKAIERVRTFRNTCTL